MRMHSITTTEKHEHLEELFFAVDDEDFYDDEVFDLL
jgi:hypothetical protein